MRRVGRNLNPERRKKTSRRRTIMIYRNLKNKKRNDTKIRSKKPRSEDVCWSLMLRIRNRRNAKIPWNWSV